MIVPLQVLAFVVAVGLVAFLFRKRPVLAVWMPPVGFLVAILIGMFGS